MATKTMATLLLTLCATVFAPGEARADEPDPVIACDAIPTLDDTWCSPWEPCDAEVGDLGEYCIFNDNCDIYEFDGQNWWMTFGDHQCTDWDQICEDVDSAFAVTHGDRVPRELPADCEDMSSPEPGIACAAMAVSIKSLMLQFEDCIDDLQDIADEDDEFKGEEAMMVCNHLLVTRRHLRSVYRYTCGGPHAPDA